MRMSVIEALAIKAHGWSTRIEGQPAAYKEACLVVGEMAERAFREHQINFLKRQLEMLQGIKKEEKDLMCYANPTESLRLSRETMTPEQWVKFEADFQHFCDYSGLKRPTPEMLGRYHLTFEWAKWAYLCGKGL